jgi:predicted ArsR family transcriptional regulator
MTTTGAMTDLGESEKKTLEALKEQGPASFTDLVERGVLPDQREAKRVEYHLKKKRLVRRVAVARQGPCEECRCCKLRRSPPPVGRPRVLYDLADKGS